MNAVHIIGRLTRDLELKYTQNGKAVGTGTLAVDRYSKGEKKADFIPFVIWEKGAENLANFTKKGSRISLSGSIQTRSYENKDGQKVFVVELLVDSYNGFDLLDPKQADNNGPETTQGLNHNRVLRENAQNGGFNDYTGAEDPFLKSGQTIDIQDSDLPF
ncbi:single-stranded DNA-binding protein [Jeotgalibaca sp. A127]|uniref:single-stranded DNA-binding protein n=1 Tax=Jeotgalibaca sp. A127 TaxID=3457324 RepID=UPI003FD3FD79